MPIYEYECKSCENVFEVQQRMSDGPLKECPECKGEVKKLVSASSFMLKGGGWYADGYSSPSSGKSNKPAEKSSSAPPCSQGGSGACKNCPAANG